MIDIPNSEPQHISEILAEGVLVGGPDAERRAKVIAKDLVSEHAGLQAERVDLAKHAEETGDPALGPVLTGLTQQQVIVRAEMGQKGVDP